MKSNMKNIETEVMVATLVCDPLEGKTLNMFTNGEELDVGQILPWDNSELIDLGVIITDSKSSVQLVFDLGEIRAVEFHRQPFDSKEGAVKWISSQSTPILATGGEIHSINGRCVLECCVMSSRYNHKLSTDLLNVKAALTKLKKSMPLLDVNTIMKILVTSLNVPVANP